MFVCVRVLCVLHVCVCVFVCVCCVCVSRVACVFGMLFTSVLYMLKFEVHISLTH